MSVRHPARPLLLTALLLLSVSVPVVSISAHETMPTAWCVEPGAQPQIVSTFNFNKQQMLTMAQQVQETLGPEGLIAEGLAERMPDGRCGIVDRWKMAVYILQNHCEAQTASPNAIFNVTSPQAFLSPTHHVSYDFTGGVQGSCAVCATPTTP